jgi:hypothetical protein
MSLHWVVRGSLISEINSRCLSFQKFTERSKCGDFEAKCLSVPCISQIELNNCGVQ